ncbi:hypothetical protein JNK13_06745 [bacterium]|nr:hypothetical protein [bacterium]
MNIFTELTTYANYDLFFDQLRAKALKTPRKLFSKSQNQPLTLAWILDNQHLVIKEIIADIQRKKYIPGPASSYEIVLGKRRVLYRMSWQDRIIEGVLAQAIYRAVDNQLSSRLYSFRKGRSHYLVVKELADFIKLCRMNRKTLLIAKYDIANYGENINHNLLRLDLENYLGNQDPYLWSLIDHFLRPQISLNHQLMKGLPTGFHLVPVCENIYLSKFDQSFDYLTETFYARFGDDILLATTDLALAQELQSRAEHLIRERCLTLNQNKSFKLAFTFDNSTPSEKNFDYLGFNINESGELFISKRRLKEFKTHFCKFTRRAHATNTRLQMTSQDSFQSLIRAVNRSLCYGSFSIFFLEIIKNCTNRKAVQHLDRWIAKKTLIALNHGSHDRIFQWHQFNNLRRAGLKSLLYAFDTRFRNSKQLRHSFNSHLNHVTDL